MYWPMRKSFSSTIVKVLHNLNVVESEKSGWASKFTLYLVAHISNNSFAVLYIYIRIDGLVLHACLFYWDLIISVLMDRC
jgi:hypothetical protein